MNQLVQEIDKAIKELNDKVKGGGSLSEDDLVILWTAATTEEEFGHGRK